MTTKPIGDSPVAWLTDEEAESFFDRNARELVGMSGKDFLVRWDRGEFRKRVDINDDRVLRLAMLIPFGRRHTR